MTSAILHFLCLPTPSWPQGLEWNCGACQARNNGDEPALCRHCTAPTRSRSMVLKNLLDSMSVALVYQLEEDTANNTTTILPLDLLLHILLSPHNRRMTGLLLGAYSIEEAIDCRCVEGGEDHLSEPSGKVTQPLTPLSCDPEGLLDTLDGSFNGDLDENLLLDTPESARSRKKTVSRWSSLP